ncbi:hypothetical protein Pmar_PMAR025549 [Perkinsus marinus ATCC 50983]|uniref:RRM domain-containing protein n=1 Tax=Perkinsus marinus (strain ATCC 50983 / TXsc) TaxID=423536 RepID=C5LZD1_PERM5|nr:hypothetical protein Pmar_PMAR025549 [Perkinsus marinus ATCC 50983]EEQ97925.1 hypothetical protein Pmar_PMAR025549 [Perkinsus marinus ATCC 50983]|eukprot:XP_002765208.1 hypothetical protein Pmar_PMAR025549 [Perkinsus marinus ATCC 50983]
MFERYGAIQSVKIVRDKTTGISMGFGFVNFDTNEAAEAAVNALNTTVLPEGKRMKVSVARPAWKANIHSNLYVSGIPLSYTEKDIEDLFGPEYKSHIEAMRLLYDQTEQQNFRGIAVVRFDTEESAYNAMKAFSNCQLTDPVSKITSSLQLKPWRPEFRADRVDSEVMREQLLVGQQTTSSGLQPVAGPRGSRAYSTGMFNVKPPLQPYTAKQQFESSRYAPRSRFASSSIGLSRAHRPQSESTADKHSGNWESAWNEYLRNVIGSQGSKNGDKTGQPFGFASSPSPPQLLSTTVPDSSLMMQAAAAMDQRGIMGGGELPSYSGRGLASGEWTDSGALLSPPTPSTSSQAALFIFHLPPDCDDATLRMLFEQYGQIDSVKIVRDKSTGISMGFGFVNFDTNEAAEAAVNALNTTVLPEGKRMKVSVARPAWKANIHSNLYVSGIPLSYTEKDIEDLFGPEYKSHIEAMRLLYDQTEQQNFRGIAVVRFDTEESAYNAMKAFSNCQLTDPVSKITSSLQLKPWRPEFRADRVDSEVMREQLLVGQQTTSPGLQPVAGLRGSRAYSTGMFNVKSPLQPYTAKQQSETSRYAPRSRFASSSIGLSRAYRPQSESTTDKHSGNWESAWNEYLRNVIGSQGSKNGDKTGQPFGFASSPSPPQLLSTTVPDSSLMMQAAAAMDQRVFQPNPNLSAEDVERLKKEKEEQKIKLISMFHSSADDKTGPKPTGFGVSKETSSPPPSPPTTTTFTFGMTQTTEAVAAAATTTTGNSFVFGASSSTNSITTETVSPPSGVPSFVFGGPSTAPPVTTPIVFGSSGGFVPTLNGEKEEKGEHEKLKDLAEKPDLEKEELLHLDVWLGSDDLLGKEVMLEDGTEGKITSKEKMKDGSDPKHIYHR